MKIVIGLGNPGTQYKSTRHNVGFEVINKLASEHNIEINKAKHRAHIGEGTIFGEKVMLVKPQTYMNLSGECLHEILGFYKCTSDDIIVTYDDVSLNVGDIRIREKGSAGGHNGIKNIIAHVGNDVFLRVKVGVGEKPSGWDLADYVLSKFKKDEEEDIMQGIYLAADAVSLLIKEGPRVAMNKYNIKSGSAEN